ncbi:MAG: aminoglycoside phosphotransferase family protein [Myxococcota bacterium]|nr:aminoglycoside phosphotransferase family protein [Myxococcota bacterium]
MTTRRWTEHDAQAHVASRLGRPVAGAKRLAGGLLNHVHRVWFADGPGSVVVKHAPPHVATAPSIPLDPSRAAFEAAGLQWAGARRDARVVVPQVLDAVPGTLVLEDLGELPDLGSWLAAGGDAGALDRLGGWLRALHADPDPPELWNAPVQRTRLAVQYAPVAARLDALGVPDATALGAKARRLGERLLERGETFVMGDLWPPSVRMGGDGRPRVIDWELCTRGHPCQDLGHLAAHLWRGGARGRWQPGLARRFLGASAAAASSGTAEIAVHFACEVLVRTAGPFRAGGPYAGLPDGHPHVRAAIGVACAVLRSEQLPRDVAPGSWPR